MPVQTKIKWRDYLKTIEYFASVNFGRYEIINKRGSGRRIELFKEPKDKDPCDFVVVHEDVHNKVIYTKDLKKTCTKLGVSTEEFTKKSEE